jgi:isocitrate dehydrogenase
MAHGVSIAQGDGIGPEIVEAVQFVLRESGTPVEFSPVRMGLAMYREGHPGGIHPEVWSSVRETGLLLKGPITTPQGGGVKSLNVTLRKTLGLFANVRPVRAFHPVLKAAFPTLDMVIVRENEEDLYAGIEHRQTDEVYQCLKLISRPGTERLIRYAFEYARANGRSRVTCMTKDNIMKMTDGLFHRVFDEVSSEYPELRCEHMIIDIGTARLATDPERFDVVVLPNLYGDILSDVAAELSGSVGLAGSCNRGEKVSMYEAIHGSAPDIAGKGVANPSGLLNAAILLLRDLGLHQAETIENAWLCALEDGVHTGDLRMEGSAHAPVGTMEFARAVVDRLGQRPERLPVALPLRPGHTLVPRLERGKRAAKELVGVDVFLDWVGHPEVIGHEVARIAESLLPLQMVTNRGVMVWPSGHPETFCTDHWRCRFHFPDRRPISHVRMLELLGALAYAGWECIKTENLYFFDGEQGYSAGQGQ